MDRLTRRDVVSGGVLILLALLYYLATLELPAGDGEPGPAFFPRLLAAVLLALGVRIVLGGIREAGQSDLPASGKPVVLIGATLAYLAIFAPLGFVLSTLAYTLFTARLLGGRGISSLLVPLVATALVYALFAIGLALPLP
ncbi:MAG TPA: tripartite tricarboxylate transporter TctB family protein [Vicinamibacteria bacterium]|nr:tripartite tricarboxylate transporter TctB family protein [Vicinamibacteria bacterium]